MRKVAVLVMLALVVPAMADLYQGAKLVGSGAIGRGAPVYDNTTTSTHYGFQDLIGNQIGDEIFPDFTGAPGNILDDLAITVGSFDNFDPNNITQPGMHSVDLSVDIFNSYDGGSSFTFAGNVSLPGTVVDLFPAYFAVVEAHNLASQNIVLGDDVLITVTASNVTLMPGALPISNVGQLMYNPPTVGYSPDYFYDTGNWYWFGGNPVANMYYFLGAVPEPSSLALLALGALTLVRRR